MGWGGKWVRDCTRYLSQQLTIIIGNGGSCSRQYRTHAMVTAPRTEEAGCLFSDSGCLWIECCSYRYHHYHLLTIRDRYLKTYLGVMPHCQAYVATWSHRLRDILEFYRELWASQTPRGLYMTLDVMV